MIAKLLLQNSLYVVAMGVLLFASAGTLAWPSAWVFLATSAIMGPLPACGLRGLTRHCSRSGCVRRCRRISRSRTRNSCWRSA